MGCHNVKAIVNISDAQEVAFRGHTLLLSGYQI